MKPAFMFFLMFFCTLIMGQSNLGDFISIEPASQSSELIIPQGFRFQKIIESGEALTAGGSMNGNHDITGYVPIGGSSANGYLSISKEATPGGVSIVDIALNNDKLWEISASQEVDFSGVDC